ncbi:MAG: acyltransferase [Acidobacteriota bacterium]|nr:acyltransferase [Acidobacteriota bacterium]
MLEKSYQTSATANLLDLFDFCKGIAIAGVVLVHIIHSGFGWQGVHVFIILSGFGLAYSRTRKREVGGWAKWYRRRLLKIFPSYYATAFFGFVVVTLYYLMGLHPTTISQSAEELVRTFFLLRNFSYKGMFAYPNSSLWYVPLVIGFYLVFPLLYRSSMTRRFLLILAITAFIEFLYRTYALYYLDGVPVAFGNGFLPRLKPPDFGQKLIPDEVAFQLWAPFGFFPSRIGEFAVGVVGGIFYAESRDVFERRIFSSLTALVGLALWLVGNALLYVGLWGWIFADYFIAIGFTLVIIHLARLALSRFNRGFRTVSKLGSVSYYVFLTHLIFMFMFAFSYRYWGKYPLLALPLAVLMIAGIVVMSLLLKRLDGWISSEKDGK